MKLLSPNKTLLSSSNLLTSCLLICIFFLSACSGVTQRSANNSVSSSLANFLYNDKHTKASQAQQIPQLTLPVKIGIAFLPSTHWRGNSLDSSTEQKLLNKVKSRFSEYRFIDNITIIPSTYLRHKPSKSDSSSGFDTLSQLARLHGVDLITLVSYDQLTRSDHNSASLLYWTIVGLYVIPGNENTIQTFVDTAVFDVKSRQLLMRAPGVSKINTLSTAVGVSKNLNRNSQEGFKLAFDDMIVNLDDELVRFKAQIKEGKTVKIANLQSYSAGGSFSAVFLLIILSILITNRYRKQCFK